MDRRKRKEIKIMSLVAVLIGALTITAGAAYAFSGNVGSEYEVYDGGRIVYGPGDGGYSNSKKTDLEDGLGERYSYCIQPDKDTPLVTRVRIAKVIDRENASGEWGALRRIVFFSPSYPGYEKDMNGIRASYYTGNFAEDWGIAHLAMSYVFLGRPSDMATYLSTKASDLGYIWIKAKKLGDAMMNEVPERDSGIPENFRVFVSGTEGYQSMAVGNLEVPGTISIKKTSSLNEITSGNSRYSLKGAKYTLYNDKSEAVRTVTLNENGESGPISISPGNYTLVESEAPKGYAKDASVRKISVVSGADSFVEVSDIPVTAMPEIILIKSPEGFSEDHGEGDAVLKGAVYCFEYYGEEYGEGAEPLKTWYFETDEKGEIKGSRQALKEGYKSDTLYMNQDGSTVFPLGVYTAREVEPSEGYLTDESVHIIEITEDGTGSVYTKNTAPASSQEKVIRGGVKIVKTDAQTGESGPQGDATLKGAEFSVINRSYSEVQYEGSIVRPGEKVMTVVTSEDGIAETARDALPYGTYSVVEENAPEGYIKDDKWEQTFSIRKNGEIIDLSGDPVKNTVMRSGLKMIKLDGELMRSESLGGASLEGIKVTVRNLSKNSILVRSGFDDEGVSPEWSDEAEIAELLKKGELKPVAPGEDIGELTFRWNEKEKAYTAETMDRDLPYGTYGIRETETNSSYQRSDKAEHIVELRSDGKILASEGNAEDILSFVNYAYRSDIRGTKIKDSTSERLSFVPFKITSLTNGETHVVVTDRNGVFFTGDRRTEDELDEKEQNDTKRAVNTFDDLLNKSIILNSDIEGRENDIRMGVWFGTGEKGSRTSLKEGSGALPFDTYVIEEMRCENNTGCTLQRFMFTVDEKSLSGIVDLETITDDIPEIETYAEASGRKTDVKVTEKAVITDVISYRDLVPGKSYIVKGRLIDKETGEALRDGEGGEVTAQKEFTAKKRNGKVTIRFEFDASEMYGRTTVVFEKLYDDRGHLVAVHEDIDDEGQTISWEKQEKKKDNGKKDDKEVPKTGDDIRLMPWGISLMIASGALICIRRRTKKTRL